MHNAPDINVLSAAQAGQPEAQYRLGALYFSRGEIQTALEWLKRAADNRAADAENLLGVIYLNGIGVACQPQTAAEFFTAAAEQDLKEAHFNLAGLLFSGKTTRSNDEMAWRHLLRAAELRHRPALRVLGYLYGVAGDRVLAQRCFTHAALAGDAHSEYMLGMHYLHDAAVDANIDEAVYWLGNAAGKRLYCASLRLQSLVAQIGETRVQRILREHIPEARQAAADPMSLYTPDIKSTGDSPVAEHAPGTVHQYADILDEHLCDYLINLAAPALLPSGVVDPATGKALQTSLRTSSSMNFQLSMYDMAVGVACRRLAGLAGVTATHAEPISVLRYLPGEEYKPHYDHFAVDEHGTPRVQDANGQRIVTVFVYLNDVEAGGETDFPRLGERVQPGKGKAVAFLNCNAAGHPNLDMLHAGMPVVRGEKWLATLWFRERPFKWI